MNDDHDYWRLRAEQELDQAQLAVHPAAVSAHYELLSHYLDRLYGDARPLAASSQTHGNRYG